MVMLMPRSRFRPLLPALALGATLVLSVASAAAVAQTGVAQIEADGMPLRLVYPSAARARPMASGPFNLSVAPAAPLLPGSWRVVLISHGTGGNPLAEHTFHADHLLRHCGACTPLAVMAGAGHIDAMSPWPSSVATAVAERHPVGGRPEPGFDPAERAAAQVAIVQHFVRHLAP
jgi:hypothetical protein